MGMALNAAAGLISLVCWILTLVRMFQNKEKGGVVHGIIGIVTCGIWAYIWGWMHGPRNLSFAWTAAIALGFIARFVFGVA